MQKIIFNARFENTGKRIRSISGRLGEFIFRTSQDGQISCYYKPRKNDSLSGQCPSILDALSSHLRDIARDLGLSVASINYQIPEP